MKDDANIIEIRNLSVSFAGRAAIHDVNVSVPRKGITFLIGPSGSGKTTLLRAINRLNECFPQCRTDGGVRLRLDGRWVDAYADELPLETLRRKAAMVFQTPNVLPASIEKNFAIPLQSVLGCSRAEVGHRMEQALEEAQLFDQVRDRLHDNALTLSGGQQQRLCLARALALEPDILLLDEPTANLDFVASRKIEQLLESLKERYAILAVSHSLGQTRRLASHVVLLRDGQVARSFEHEDLADATLFQQLVVDTPM